MSEWKNTNKTCSEEGGPLRAHCFSLNHSWAQAEAPGSGGLLLQLPQIPEYLWETNQGLGNLPAASDEGPLSRITGLASLLK